MNQMKKITGFPSVLVEILKTNDETNCPLPIKQSASVYLKNLVSNSYRTDLEALDQAKEFSIHENDKAFLRENVLEAVVVVPDQIRNQLAVVINKMIKADYDTGKWQNDLNQKILDFIQNENSTPHMWLAALIALLQLTKVFEYKSEKERSLLLNAMQTFLPVMLDVSNKLIEDNTSNAQLLQKYILKIFFALSQYNLPQSILQNQIDRWMIIFQKVLEAPVPAESAELDEEDRLELPHWKAKKWALHIITRLFERYGAPGSVEDEYEEFAKFFLENCAVPLLNIQMGILVKKRNGEWVSPRVIQLILTYLTQSVNHAKTWECLKGEVFGTMLKELLFPLMCFTEEDAELWEDDPEEYIRIKFDVFEEMTNPKSAAEDFLSIATTKRKGPLTIAMQFVQGLLVETDSLSAAQYDGVFNLICSLSDQLMKKKPYKNQIDQLTTNFFIPLCTREQGYLRARGLHCIKRFSEANLKKQTIKKVFDISLQLLCKADEDLPVRVEAAMALSKLASENPEKASDFMKTNIGTVLEKCLKLVNETINDDLTDVVKQFIQEFSEEVEPFAVQLAEGIAESFIHMAGNCTETDEDYDNKALTSVGILTTLETLLEMMEDSADLVTALEEVVVKVIKWVFQHRKMDYYEEAMSLLSSVTTHHVSDNVWDALPVLNEILDAGDDGGVEFFVDMMPAVHNFVTVNSQKFFDDVNNLQVVFGMVSTVLNSDDSGEDAETHALKLLEVCIFQVENRVPGVISNAVNLAYERGFGQIAIQRDVKTSELRTMCVQVIMAGLYTDQTQETLNYLNTKNWMDSGIRQWLDDFDCIFGIHDRRLALMTVAKFLSAGGVLPRAILDNSTTLFTKCMMLFKGLEKAYEWKAAEEDSEDGSVDSDDEDMAHGDETAANSFGREDITNELDDNEDDLDDGKQYLEMLKRFQLEDGEDEGETAMEDYTTVIDEDGIPFIGAQKDKEGTVIQHEIPDEYIIFMEAINNLQTTNLQMYQTLIGSLDKDDAKYYEHVQGLAKKRFNAKKSEGIKNQGGYDFKPDLQANFNFTNNS